MQKMNAGKLLKRAAIFVLALSILYVSYSLVIKISEINEKLVEAKDGISYAENYLSTQTNADAVTEKLLEAQLTAAWVAAGVSLLKAIVGCIVLYVLGDIADNVWKMAKRTEQKREDTANDNGKAPAVKIKYAEQICPACGRKSENGLQWCVACGRKFADLDKK